MPSWPFIFNECTFAAGTITEGSGSVSQVNRFCKCHTASLQAHTDAATRAHKRPVKEQTQPITHAKQGMFWGKNHEESSQLHANSDASSHEALCDEPFLFVKHNAFSEMLGASISIGFSGNNLLGIEHCELIAGVMMNNAYNTVLETSEVKILIYGLQMNITPITEMLTRVCKYQNPRGSWDVRNKTAKLFWPSVAPGAHRAATN